MASTVNNAFNEFMKNIVNLNPHITSAARRSRDNLLANIAEFDNDDGFFELCNSFNVHFGSFARRTKCRELDDIDLMIGIAASGATYNAYDKWDDVKIKASSSNSAQIECTRADGTLNSTQVVNKFKKKLEQVREYSRSDIKKNGEAIVLNLKSREWSFDVVPCFHTEKESDGREYYLIPNGKGNWKKTDPIIDREHVKKTNRELEGGVLELIRLFKKWNKVKNAKTIPSYLLETMIINYCDSKQCLENYIDVNFREALKYIEDNISYKIYDMKEIQGNINELKLEEKLRIKQKAKADYEKACNAFNAEVNEENQKKAINIWRDIFGSDFPEYSNKR